MKKISSGSLKRPYGAREMGVNKHLGFNLLQSMKGLCFNHHGDRDKDKVAWVLTPSFKPSHCFVGLRVGKNVQRHQRSPTFTLWKPVGCPFKNSLITQFFVFFSCTDVDCTFGIQREESTLRNRKELRVYLS